MKRLGDIMNEDRKRIMNTPLDDLKPGERILKDVYGQAAERQLYVERIFAEKGKAQVRIAINKSIDALIDYYQSKGMITATDAAHVLAMPNTFGLKEAIDYLDCEVLKIREKGKTFFDC